MTSRHPYDAAYDPPAPVLPVAVAAPGSPLSVAVAFLIDTGADVTVLPESVVTDLDLPLVGEVTVRGATGAIARAGVHAADMEIAGASGTHEVLSLGEDALLGRDLLGRFVVTLDGPGASVEIAEA